MGQAVGSVAVVCCMLCCSSAYAFWWCVRQAARQACGVQERVPHLGSGHVQTESSWLHMSEQAFQCMSFCNSDEATGIWAQLTGY